MLSYSILFRAALGRELRRRLALQAPVRTPLSVVHPPLLAHIPRLYETHEPVLAQALISELPVEALDVAVLHRPAPSQ